MLLLPSLRCILHPYFKRTVSKVQCMCQGGAPWENFIFVVYVQDYYQCLQKNFITTVYPLTNYFEHQKIQIIKYGDAGDRTRGLSHAKRTLYHWATSPLVQLITFLFYFFVFYVMHNLKCSLLFPNTVLGFKMYFILSSMCMIQHFRFSLEKALQSLSTYSDKRGFMDFWVRWLDHFILCRYIRISRVVFSFLLNLYWYSPGNMSAPNLRQIWITLLKSWYINCHICTS